MRSPLNKLERRVIDISHKKKLSHLSSCLTAVRIIDQLYQVMRPDDIFVLSSGHAGLALYVALEKKFGIDAEMLFDKHGVHPNRDIENKIYCSSGSLGSAIGVAVGMAIASPAKNVYVMISDGECAEGSVWEALRFAGEMQLNNLRVIVNINGTGAYGKIDGDILETRLMMFYPCVCIRTNMFKYPYFLQGYDGHYKVLTNEDYTELTTLT